MEIEIKPHIGTTASGEVVEHDQAMVFADKCLIGYLGNKPGSALLIIRDVPPAMRVEIESAVAAKTGRPELSAVQVPQIKKLKRKRVKNDDIDP